MRSNGSFILVICMVLLVVKVSAAAHGNENENGNGRRNRNLQVKEEFDSGRKIDQGSPPGLSDDSDGSGRDGMNGYNRQGDNDQSRNVYKDQGADMRSYNGTHGGGMQWMTLWMTMTETMTETATKFITESASVLEKTVEVTVTMSGSGITCDSPPAVNMTIYSTITAPPSCSSCPPSTQPPPPNIPVVQPSTGSNAITAPSVTVTQWSTSTMTMTVTSPGSCITDTAPAPSPPSPPSPPSISYTNSGATQSPPSACSGSSRVFVINSSDFTPGLTSIARTINDQLGINILTSSASEAGVTTSTDTTVSCTTAVGESSDLQLGRVINAPKTAIIGGNSLH